MAKPHNIGGPLAGDRGRRFRILFWLVVALGALPELVSGFVLRSHFSVDTLCAAMRPVVDVATFASILRWQHVHDWGRLGALVAGLLVLGYAGGWAYEAKLTRGRRRAMMALLIGVLLPSLAIALWTGRALPWQALSPGISLGPEAPSILPGRSSEEAGGPAYCLDHAAEVNRMRLAYFAHLAAGTVGLGLTLALADFAARWRRAKDATSASRSS
jgi:hypothetical protein